MTKPALTTSDIRHDIAARLAVLPGVSVFDSRVIDADVDELPAVTVRTASGPETVLSATTLLTRRVDRFHIQGIVKAGSTATFELALGDTLDALADAIVDVLFTDGEWRGSFERVALVGEISREWGKTEARALVGEVLITVEVQYSRRPTDASESLSALYVLTEPTEPDGADVSDRRML